MPSWLAYLVGLAALLILAPLAAWIGHRHGRSIRGGLALVMLGFGQVVDPPSKHVIEAQEGDEDERDASGEPKTPRRPP